MHQGRSGSPQQMPIASQKVRGQKQRTHFIVHWNSHFYYQFNNCPFNSLYLGNSGITYWLNRQPPRAWRGRDGKAGSNKEKTCGHACRSVPRQKKKISCRCSRTEGGFLLRWQLWLLPLYKQGHIMARNRVCCVCLLLGSGVLVMVMAPYRTYRGSKAVKQRNIPDWTENGGRSGCTWAWMGEGVEKKMRMCVFNCSSSVDTCHVLNKPLHPQKATLSNQGDCHSSQGPQPVHFAMTWLGWL